jgi:hypothetical protein
MLSLCLQWVGSECGHHATYTFYKAAKYQDGRQGEGDRWRLLAIGQFFFVKIWPGSDLVSVAELQLLWEDKVSNQFCETSSVRGSSYQKGKYFPSSVNNFFLGLIFPKLSVVEFLPFCLKVGRSFVRPFKVMSKYT